MEVKGRRRGQGHLSAGAGGGRRGGPLPPTTHGGATGTPRHPAREDEGDARLYDRRARGLFRQGTVREGMVGEEALRRPDGTGGSPGRGRNDSAEDSSLPRSRSRICCSCLSTSPLNEPAPLSMTDGAGSPRSHRTTSVVYPQFMCSSAAPPPPRHAPVSAPIAWLQAGRAPCGTQRPA